MQRTHRAALPGWSGRVSASMFNASAAWRPAFEQLRNDFWEAGKADLTVRHLRARPVGESSNLPECWKKRIDVAETVVPCEWSPAVPELFSHAQPEKAFLYGSKAGVEQFKRLAERAWMLYPGSTAGKHQATLHATCNADRWLAMIYHNLSFSQVGMERFESLYYDCVAYRLEDGRECIESSARYDLPETPGPIHKGELPELTIPFERWVITELAVDLFTASAVVIDMMLADPDPEGTRLISWQEFDAWHRSPTFQQANFRVDVIRLARGQQFALYRSDCKPSSAVLPSVCPKADPKLPVELQPDGDMLAEIDARYRSLHLIGDDQTIHWVGRELTPETSCTCNLTAPGASPSPERQNLRQLRLAIVTRDYEQAARLGALSGFALPDALCRDKSEWRAVRVAVDARLAALDHCTLPCQTATGLQLDSREVSLEAPAGTPAPLRQAYDAVADALFQAAEMRRCPPAAHPMFEDQASALADAYHAARDRYAPAERLLQAVTDDAGHCAHQAALNAACRVNDAAGHVMLGIVPPHRAVVHVQAVPTFDLTALLQAMRRQTSRAALQLNGGDMRDGPESEPRTDRDIPQNHGKGRSEPEPPQYVTLDQVAALINRKKKTLERYLNEPKYKKKFDMPQPEVEGGGGKPHEWLWPTLQPWLEKTFGRKLPERFPRR